MADWNWITDRIAIGGEPARADVAAMLRQGITDVLDLRGEPRAGETGPHPELYEGTGIRYHYVPMLDRGGNQPARVFQEGVAIMAGVLADPSRRLLVHCQAGMYRSPSMVYAYLRYAGYRPDDAWQMIVRSRTIARRQYVASAEAAVPSLAGIQPSVPAGGQGTVAILLIAAGAIALGWYVAGRYQEAARLPSRHRGGYAA